MQATQIQIQSGLTPQKMQYISHRGAKIPKIGLGTYGLGLDDSRRDEEKSVLQIGVEKYGLTMIDTAECYGDGASERLVGEAIKGYDRNKMFVVDKILPQNAQEDAFFRSCERSLCNLGANYVDLYLLHWREGLPLQKVANGMQSLVKAGLVRHWGVSNFDVGDMQELFECKGGDECFCNQILYNLASRGAEYDLIPWCQAHEVLVTAYSPLCHGGEMRRAVAEDPVVVQTAKNQGKTAESLLLSFAIRQEGVAAVFKTSKAERLENNMHNVFQSIDKNDLEALSKRFKAPTCRCELEKI